MWDVIACCRRAGWCYTKLWPYQKLPVEQWALYFSPRIHLWNRMWVSKNKAINTVRNKVAARLCFHRGRAWQGACVAEGGMHCRGHAWYRACMAVGCAWRVDVHGRGEVCVAGGGACMGEGYCSGRYAPHWNAFL